MKNFAYVHFIKCSSWGRGKRVSKGQFTGRNGGIQGLWEHDMRLIETPNANPTKLHKNSIICQETGWRPAALTKENMDKIGCNDPEFITKRAKQMLEDMGIKEREDSVKVLALMLHASPQFLRNGTDDGPLDMKKVGTWAAGTIAYLKEKYGERLISAVIHMDETNPHMSAYIVPLVQKVIQKRGPKPKKMKEKPREETVQWRLCAKDMLTPDKVIMKMNKETKEEIVDDVIPGTCSLMQDEYAETLQRFSLDVRRGVKKPIRHRGIKHELNMDLYVRRTAPVAHVKSLSTEELLNWAILAAPAAEDAARAKEQRDHYQICAADAQEKAAKLEKSITDSNRELPVEDVIRKLTPLAQIDPNDRPDGPGGGKKRTDIQMEFLLPNGMRIGISSNNRFENLTPEIKFAGKNANRFRGKGAIDAVTFVTGWDVKEATEWLADNFSDGIASREIAHRYEAALSANRDNDERVNRKNHAEKLIRELEYPEHSKWESTRQTLLKTFRFREKSIDALHENNWLNSNIHGHLLFQKARLGNDNSFIPTGKLVIDPQNFDTPLHESGDNGFVFDLDPDAEHTIICASPLDAMALRSTPEHYSANILTIGKNPNEITKEILQNLLNGSVPKILLAENLMTQGRNLAAWITESFGEKIALLKLPEGFRHWLDYHRRPRVKSDPGDLRVVRFPDTSQATPDEKSM